MFNDYSEHNEANLHPFCLLSGVFNTATLMNIQVLLFLVVLILLAFFSLKCASLVTYQSHEFISCSQVSESSVSGWCCIPYVSVKLSWWPYFVTKEWSWDANMELCFQHFKLHGYDLAFQHLWAILTVQILQPNFAAVPWFDLCANIGCNVASHWICEFSSWMTCQVIW